MKTLRLVIALLLFMVNGYAATAQQFKLRTSVPGEKAKNYTPKEDKKLLASPDYFLGRWIAENEDMAYELEFIKDTIRIDDMISDEYYFSEYVLGKITYYKNEIIIRETNYNGLYSVLRSRVSNPYSTHFNYQDKETMVWRELRFTIDKDDPKKAQWKLGAPHNDWDGKWNKFKPDIPVELSFRKIE